MISASIDHGSNRTGWSIFKDGKYVASGVWDSFRTQYPQVLLEFYDRLGELYIDYQPKLFVFEKQVSVQNMHSTAVLHQLNGLEYLFCLQNNVAFHNYNPSEWRKLIGYSKSEKLEIGYAVAEEFGLNIDKICVPVRYVQGPKNGTVKEYLMDESDAIAINWAYWRSIKDVKSK